MSSFELSHLSKSFIQGEKKIEVLRDIQLRLQQAESVAIIGESGTGKSTLLHCCGLLDRADGGKVFYTEQEVSNLSDSERTKIRQEKVGFVFQFHYLMAELSAEENVALPLLIARQSFLEAREKAQYWLQKVGLGERMDHLPKELSGGEQQRVAIARALIHEPSLVLADEPTGNLDPKTAQNVFDVLMNRVQELKSACVMVTHNQGLASRMSRQLVLREGSLE